MPTETTISADARIRFGQYVRDLWNYRDLFRALVERDLKVRYKQTVLGIIWVILVPLSLAGVFSVIFTRVVTIDTQRLPPLLFFLAGSIPWMCFANGLSQSANSMESNAGLLSKIYFPRLIIPGAMILGTVVDFVIGWVFFNIMAAIWGHWTWLFIPFTAILLVIQLATAMGIGLIFAILNAQYRDIRYAVPFLIQLGMWISPVVWPAKRLLATRLGSDLVFFLYLNPMAGVIESYRALLIGDYLPYRLLASNFIAAFLLLVGGIVFFKKREQKIIDLL